MKVWILTSEYNDYDQYGEYFVAVFGQKPTPAELIANGVPEADVSWVLQGGGREEKEDIWFHLHEHDVGVAPSDERPPRERAKSVRMKCTYHCTRDCKTAEDCDQSCKHPDARGVVMPLAEQCAEHGECTEKAMDNPECTGRCKALGVSPHQTKPHEKWICLLCMSDRPDHHGTLDDGVTPCPNKR